jgi:hypothetical protein
MNPNYALKVREDLDKLLDIGFIHPIETTKWLSPLIIVPKKKKKIQIYVDYHKLNAQTKKIHSLYPRGRSLNQLMSFFFFYSLSTHLYMKLPYNIITLPLVD